MKRISFILILLLLSTSIYAQNKLSVYSGISNLSSSESYDNGFDASINYSFTWKYSISFNISFDYQRFNYNVDKHNSKYSEAKIIDGGDLSIYSSAFNAEYAFHNKSIFEPFITAGLGFYITDNSDLEFANAGTSLGLMFDSKNDVFYRVGIGSRAKVTNFLNLSLRYDYYDMIYETSNIRFGIELDL